MIEASYCCCCWIQLHYHFFSCHFHLLQFYFSTENCHFLATFFFCHFQFFSYFNFSDRCIMHLSCILLAILQTLQLLTSNIKLKFNFLIQFEPQIFFLFYIIMHLYVQRALSFPFGREISTTYDQKSKMKISWKIHPTVAIAWRYVEDVPWVQMDLKTIHISATIIFRATSW